jgi:hypothetical protein
MQQFQANGIQILNLHKALSISSHAMKTLILLLLLLFSLTNSAFAQENFHLSNDSDTAFWYANKNNYARQFKLGFIENDTNAYSFRFWASGLVIKVVGNKNQHFGEIIRFVEAYPKKKKKKVFTKHYPITSSQASQVRHLIDSLQIETLPSDKNIKGWEQGLDGIEYFTEFKKNGLYTFKNYWTPTAQDTLKEAILFQSFVSSLSNILDLKNNGKLFQDDIPFASWIYPGSASVALRVKPK